MHFDQVPEATEAKGERRRMRYSPSCHGVAPVRGYRWQASRRSRASGGSCPAWDNANLAPAKSQALHGPARTLPQHCVHGRWRVVVVRRVRVLACIRCMYLPGSAWVARAVVHRVRVLRCAPKHLRSPRWFGERRPRVRLLGEAGGNVVHAHAPAIIRERIGYLDVNRFRAIAAGAG